MMASGRNRNGLLNRMPTSSITPATADEPDQHDPGQLGVVLARQRVRLLDHAQVVAELLDPADLGLAALARLAAVAALPASQPCPWPMRPSPRRPWECDRPCRSESTSLWACCVPCPQDRGAPRDTTRARATTTCRVVSPAGRDRGPRSPAGRAGRPGTSCAPAARRAHPGSRSARPRPGSSTNSSGFTQRTTGWCRGEGRRYWVIVSRSQPASCRACMVSTTSSRLLAHAQDQVGLGDQPGLAGGGDHRQGAVEPEARAGSA